MSQHRICWCNSRIRVAAVDGPYIGQVFDLNYTRFARQRHFHASRLYSSIVWVVNGADRHAYTVEEQHSSGSYVLRYRDTF